MQPVTLAGTVIDRHYHACAFVNSRDEAYAVLESYIVDGIRAGEKAIHICDPALCGDHRARLGEMGVPVADCERAGQLQVIGWNDAYLKNGRFNHETMLALVEEAIHTSRAEGFERVRLMGHMEWMLDAHPDMDDVVEYERKVEDVLNHHKQPAVCVFDVSRFSGSAVIDILRIHAYVILNGAMRKNPFYLGPTVTVAA